MAGTPARGGTNLTPAALNVVHALFYREQKQLMEERQSKAKVLRLAIKMINAENSLPIRERKPFEYALQLAQVEVREKAAFAGRKGGVSAKADTLTLLIREIEKRQPGISEHKLRYRLNAEQGKGIITSINVWSHIEYEKDDGTGVRIPISALKDRLYRARMEIPSR